MQKLALRNTREKKQNRVTRVFNSDCQKRMRVVFVKKTQPEHVKNKHPAEARESFSLKVSTTLLRDAWKQQLSK